MGENVYMLPSDMNLKIKTRTVRYNNEILVPDGKFSLGKNDEVNALEPVTPTPKISHKAITVTHKNSNVIFKNLAQKPTITHEDEKLALILFNWRPY